MRRHWRSLVTSHVWVTLALAILSIWLHELGHAYVAALEGDRLGGRRLTIKPLVNLDPLLSLIVPLVTSLASGGVFAVGIGRPFLLTGPSVLISIAGPATNLLLAVVLWIAGWPTAALVNAVLCVFNMIPVKPLDGWAALQAWKLTRRRVGQGIER